MGLARSGASRKPAPPKESDHSLMRRLDELYTACPFCGSRRMAFELKVNRKRVQLADAADGN
jgi:putative transposase